MATPEHLAILKQGVEAWNEWRRENPKIRPNLARANLFKAELADVDLTNATLTKACLAGADLTGANLTGADLRNADISFAYLFWAHFNDANLTGACLEGSLLWRATFDKANLRRAILPIADLSGAFLVEANFTAADLRGAKLQRAVCVKTSFVGADLTGCKIYGLSAWDVTLSRAKQQNLVITPDEKAQVTVDNFEVAQFIYLLLNNTNLRNVIDTVTSKVVLILGRFTPKRKAVLDALREALRARGYSPIVFDFTPSDNRNLTETVSTLAHMARFVIPDLTDPKSVPQELMAIVPKLPSVPVQPVLLGTQRAWAMFDDLRDYPWVLEPFFYRSQSQLLRCIDAKVITPAEAKAKQRIDARRERLARRRRG